ncbi:NAD(P)H-dependent oxidoreductase [Candidatus Pelagibacter sp. RS40]|uniref:NAD(P)H-dependent oxidoreductase n=1 Tax=Candidatus Pelagibacter sp. RS40 TaxID=1977865 RepID=UPI000A162E89|nr:SAF domain-containing protein [Candidatus Pelagibacter sp. RS40]ARJ49838.1 homoserine dehydrogenase [Candidatus Pelagibacter sp. RS40]
MYLYSKLQNRSKPIRIGFIGCGKFVSMFLAQYNQLEKIQIDTIVDVNIEKAKKNCLNSGLNEKTISNINFTNSLDNTLERDIEIYIEATGNPIIGTVHATKIINNKKHIILVNVEADVTCGKFLSDLANKNNVVCSMAYGDQPSLIMEQIEWARLNGFQVICAGKGTKYHPTFEYSTPETVWDHYGLTKERAEKESGMNPKMFNSFLCGDKSAIEMCAVSNAADLKCPKDGLTFPPVGVYDIAKKLIPKDEGGLIDHSGQVEVISSIDLDKNEIENDLRWGVYIVIKAQNEYVKNCFKDYGMVTDSSGNYSAIWRPYHYIGLELAQSIYSISLDLKPTGFTKNYNSDVGAVAKKDLKAGEKLDGEGGFCSRGKLISSQKSKEDGILPLGLTDNAIVKRNIKRDELIRLTDVDIDLPKEVLEAREYQYNLI